MLRSKRFHRHGGSEELKGKPPRRRGLGGFWGVMAWVKFRRVKKSLLESRRAVVGARRQGHLKGDPLLFLLAEGAELELKNPGRKSRHWRE